MTREEVFVLIQAHLADELDLEPDQIGEGTHFKDTYGVQISDEQATEILTVGQAVDFVMAHSNDA